MTLIDKAMWFLNGHFGEELSLEDVADAAGVSRHHLAHAFGRTVGISVMGYVRGLRLSRAARELAAGAPDILAVALEAGYGSHEAFTRAFRYEFGATPEAVRAGHSFENLKLMEPLQMTGTANVSEMQKPTLRDGKSMLIAGLKSNFSYSDTAGIAALWQRFAPNIGHTASEVGGAAYGAVLAHTDMGFDYACGVEVNNFALVPDSLVKIRVPAQRYAVFRHSGHISAIRGTIRAVMTSWLPAADLQIADAPMIERYGPEFDGRTGLGGLEIWVPVKV